VDDDEACEGLDYDISEMLAICGIYLEEPECPEPIEPDIG